MTSADEAQAIRRRRRIAIIILLAGTACVVGLFAYYGAVVYQARGYDAFVRFTKFVVPVWPRSRCSPGFGSCVRLVQVDENKPATQAWKGAGPEALCHQSVAKLTRFQAEK